MHSLRVLALAVALVAAGCASLSGPSTAPPSVTPAPVPADTPTTSWPSPAPLAPGVTTAGIDDPAAVVAAHRRALSNQSYTAVVATSVVAAGDPDGAGYGPRREGLPGTPLVAVREVSRVGAGGQPAYRLRAVDGLLARPVPVVPGGDRDAVSPPATAATWTNGTAGFRRVVGDGRLAYATVPPAAAAGGPPGPSPTVPALGLFEAGSTEVVASAHPGGLIQLTGYRAAVDTDAPYPMAERVAAPRELRLAAELSPTGVVLELDVSYLGTLDGRPVVVERSFDLRDLGSTSVDRPAWVATAGNESG